jgi:AcrR family transcriptional regulator
MPMTEPRPSRGRPRDPRIDEVVLEATRRSLHEVGFAATTVQEISRRSGVHPPAIYRRWPSKRALIADAAFSGLTEISIEPSGDLRADLRRFVAAFERELDNSVARLAMPGLIAEYMGDVDLSPAQWFHFSLRPQFYAIVEAAGDDVDPGIDLDDLFDVIQGTILARVLVPIVRERRGRIEDTVEYWVRILRKPGAPEEISRPDRHRQPAARSKRG